MKFVIFRPYNLTQKGETALQALKPSKHAECQALSPNLRCWVASPESQKRRRGIHKEKFLRHEEGVRIFTTLALRTMPILLITIRTSTTDSEYKSNNMNNQKNTKNTSALSQILYS